MFGEEVASDKDFFDPFHVDEGELLDWGVCVFDEVAGEVGEDAISNSPVSEFSDSLYFVSLDDAFPHVGFVAEHEDKIVGLAPEIGGSEIFVFFAETGNEVPEVSPLCEFFCGVFEVGFIPEERDEVKFEWGDWFVWVEVWGV